MPSLPNNELRALLTNEFKLAAASQAMQVAKDIPPREGYSQRFIKQQTGLHLAVHFGLVSLLEPLLEEGQKPAAKDSDGRTPLWYASVKGLEGAMKSLSSVDRTTFTMMLAEGMKDLAGSLVQIAGPIIKDTRGRTAVHIGALYNDPDIMQWACHFGVDINSKDGDGNTPIQLAFEKKKPEAIDWLLRNSAETARITKEAWLHVYSRPKSDMIVLTGETSGPKEVSFLTLAEFETGNTFHLKKRKRLFMFESSFSWPIHASMDPQRCPKDSMLHSIRSPIEEVEEEMYRHSVIALVLVPNHTIKDKLFHWCEEEMRIAWTMKTLPGPSDKDNWASQDHFSTLPAGSIPESGASFFATLVQYMTRTWVELCDSIDDHLMQCRPDVLDGNGGDSSLISRLLKDANSWIKLRRLHDNQVGAITAFVVEYVKHGYKDLGIKNVREARSDFERVVNRRIDTLDASSSALIQLEFNLTSIREAQKSTSLNNSMKRLTWVTFIFLPLTFVSGLFGMNVDVLKGNPPWWWYLVFAVVTLGLTITVWVIFKSSRNLEDKIERWFAGLFRARKRQDLEGGLLSKRDKKRD